MLAPSGQASPGNTGELVLLLTIEDAAKALGVGRSTIYELIGKGDLEVVHIGRSARVPVESVQSFVGRLRRAG
jgi:excisionase family DNA binding protein